MFLLFLIVKRSNTSPYTSWNSKRATYKVTVSPRKLDEQFNPCLDSPLYICSLTLLWLVGEKELAEQGKWAACNLPNCFLSDKANGHRRRWPDLSMTVLHCLQAKGCCTKWQVLINSKQNLDSPP